jgi:hypothetical protein
MSHKPPEIITHFSRQLGHIMADYLTNPDLDGKRHPLKDRLAVKIMLTLSEVKLYREELLFRDYRLSNEELWVDSVIANGGIRKHYDEAMFYVHVVLCKRLQLVAKRKSFPTNLHFLLVMLCRSSVDTRWLKTWIKRSRKPATDIYAAFFKHMAEILKRQCQRAKDDSPLVKTLQERYGHLYLMVGENRAKILEEISLFDVIEAAPVPLNTCIKQIPRWYSRLLEHSLLSLNEQYGLLRSCGLPPQEFWDTLSIGRLRELKNLKQAAEAYLKSGEHKNHEEAYKQAFADMANSKTNPTSAGTTGQDKKVKVAGFADFWDFAGSEVGTTLLKTPRISIHSYGNDEPAYDPIDPAGNSHEEMNDIFAQVVANNPGKCTPVITYFFKQVIVEQRHTYGRDSILKDMEFIELVKADKKYAHLDIDKLRAKLCQDIKDLLAKANDGDGDDPSDDLVD